MTGWDSNVPANKISQIEFELTYFSENNQSPPRLMMFSLHVCNIVRSPDIRHRILPLALALNLCDVI